MGSSRSRNGSTVTVAQRAEVLRLLGEGWSVRKVAVEVFGAERFRGRVERIKVAAASKPEAPRQADEPVDLQGLSHVAAIKVLFERRLAALLADGVPPSMNELHRLLDVQRQLETIDAIERINTMTQRQTTFTASQLGDLVFGAASSESGDCGHRAASDED